MFTHEGRRLQANRAITEGSALGTACHDTDMSSHALFTSAPLKNFGTTNESCGQGLLADSLLLPCCRDDLKNGLDHQFRVFELDMMSAALSDDLLSFAGERAKPRLGFHAFVL